MKIINSKGGVVSLTLNDTKKNRKKEFWLAYGYGGDGIAISADELYAVLFKWILKNTK